MEAILLTIVLAPLAGSVIAGLLRNQIGRKGAHSITILGVGISCLLSLYVLKVFAFDGAPVYNESVYTWMVTDGLRFEIGFLIDNLTAMMIAVVTFVSLMVHIYTIGYMAHEEGYQRFFSYIALFTFSMLMLVMSNNFLQLFFGWEAVGLVSYLLIGFYFKKETAIFANLKAFLVNCPPDTAQARDMDFLLAGGELFTLVAYGQLILESAGLQGVDDDDQFVQPFLRLRTAVGQQVVGGDVVHQRERERARRPARCEAPRPPRRTVVDEVGEVRLLVVRPRRRARHAGRVLRRHDAPGCRLACSPPASATCLAKGGDFLYQRFLHLPAIRL